MAVQDYNGGGDVVLNSFYNTLNQSWNRNQARIAKEQSDQAELIAKQQKELGDIVKKVNTTGIQSQDVGDMTAKLDKIYDTYYKANKATSRDERLKLRMELERDITDMSQFVSQSKQRGVDQLKLADYQAKNPGLFSTESTKKLAELSSKPTLQLGDNPFTADKFISPDTSYLSKVVEDSAKSLLTNANVSRRLGGRQQIGNQMATNQFEDRAVGKDIFGTDLTAKYNSDVKFKNLVDYTASQIGITPQDYILGVVDEYDKASKLKQTKQLSPVMDARPRESKGDGSGSAGVGDLISVNLPFADGKGNVQLDEYVPLSIPGKNFAGSTSIDLTTGKPLNEALPSSGKYEVVGITNAPFITGRRGNALEGAIAQPNFARSNPDKIARKPVIHVRLSEDGVSNDYFIPYDRLPANVKSSKSIAQALKSFKPATTSSTPKTTTPAKSTGKKTIQGF